MMKRFVSAMLGSLAAIWISILLLFALFFLFIAALCSDSFMSQFVRAKYTRHSALYIKLDTSIIEREETGNILGKALGLIEETQSLSQIVTSLNAATNDNNIEGVYIDCYGCSAGGATLSEIREAIKRFKQSGKWVIAYGDSYTQADYFIATAADQLYINPSGMIDLHGLSATTLFYKGLLDKVGIEMQVVKVGTYKSAVEPFMYKSPSEPSIHQQRQFLSQMWTYMSSEIASDRKINIDTLNNLADSIILTAAPERYIAQRLVDKLVYRHDVEKELRQKSGLEKHEELRLISPADYCMAADIPHTQDNPNRIAILYATGDIVDEGDGGIVASEIVPLIFKIKENDEIDGLILRVNSGGGSAFASEQIWEALEQFKQSGRPFYVSMGDYAASGGYYISSGADKIYADAMTLTGSIGIFGIIPCGKELLNNHLGITTSTVSTNANANFPTLTAPMTPFQRAQMQSYVDRGYETFVTRCAVGRGMSLDSIKAIAEGRVWDAQTAVQIGLVDKIGSLNDAIWAMSATLNFGSNYMIVQYPEDSEASFGNLFSLKTKIKDDILSDELGENAWIFNNLKRIQELSPLQCRMEDIIVM